MPLVIPSLSELRTQTRSQFVSRIVGSNPTLRRMLIKVLADLYAGSLWLTYRFLVWLSQQLFLDSAETTYLERQAALDGITRLGGAKAAGTVTFSGAPDGLPVSSGLLLESSDHVVQYTTQAGGVLSGGHVDLAVEATTVGTAGNADPGASLNLLVAIAGVQSTAVSAAGLSGGTEAEADDRLRARALDRRRSPPQGGDAHDYFQWAMAVPGVTRAWVLPLNRGPGTVDVTFVMDGRGNPGTSDMIPLTDDLAAVQAAIDAVKPVTADCVVFAPVANPVTITIQGPQLAIGADFGVVENAINQAIYQLMATTTPAGALIGSGLDGAHPGGVLFLEQIYGAIDTVPGIASYELLSPVADVSSSNGYIPMLGEIDFS